MTLGARIAWDDTVLPFQLDRSDIRGRVARLDGVLDRVLAQHDYPPVIETLVAEMALLTALIGQTVKLRWKLSLQVRGDGPARLIATDYYGPTDDGEPARIRAYASYDATRLDLLAAPFSQIGKGYFAILIDQGPDTAPYQGITPIAGNSLSACAETYFAQSEQLPTRFSLTFGRSRLAGENERWRAGGVMLQHMPKASPFASGEGGSGEGGLLAAGKGDLPRMMLQRGGPLGQVDRLRRRADGDQNGSGPEDPPLRPGDTFVQIVVGRGPARSGQRLSQPVCQIRRRHRS